MRSSLRTRLWIGGVVKGAAAMRALTCVRRFATGVAIAMLTGTVVVVSPTRLNWSRCLATSLRRPRRRTSAPRRNPLDYDSPSGADVQLAVVRTVDVPGHTSLGLSFCAGALTGQYLLDPASADSIDGTVCAPEFDPFAMAPVAAAATRTQRDFRHSLLPIAAFRPPG